METKEKNPHLKTAWCGTGGTTAIASRCDDGMIACATIAELSRKAIYRWMAAPASFSDFQTAMSLLSHAYFNPIVGILVRHGVPDHLDKGPLPGSELAKLAGMDALSLMRALRALTSVGAFQEVSPGVFAHNPVSNGFRNRPGGLRNFSLHYTSDHYVKSATALGHSVVTG